MTVTDIPTEARNATLGDLAGLLQQQHAAKFDIIAPAQSLKLKEGLLVVTGAEQELTEDGVTSRDATFRPTAVFDEGIADKLTVPLSYVRRLRNERPDLLDANVNGWLHGRRPLMARPAFTEPGGIAGEARVVREGVAGDERSFLIRAFKGNDGEIGVARAMLSNSFAIIDNLDVLTAALAGVKQSGAEIEVDSCDLTERRMTVRITAPGITALAPTLLANYRSPFRDPEVERQRNHGWTVDEARRVAADEGQGYTAGGEPIIFAGLVLSNSETGDGAFSITPRLIVEVCSNGLQMSVDMIRSVHLGAKLGDGIITWSPDTEQKNLALVTAKARDAVAQFLSPDYLGRKVAELERMAGKSLAKASTVIETVGKKLAFSEETTTGILDHFIRGGQLTSGGVMQAVSSYAQVVADADLANTIEGRAVRAMELAFAAS